LAQRPLYPSVGLHGQVAHEIGRKIVSGAIGEGEVLPREAELAATHAVSRQAVREALKVLAAKGLVASRRRAGTFVLPRANWNLFDPDVLAWHPAGAIAPAFFNDLVELRKLIEPAAAALAAERATEVEIERMQAALEGMRANLKGQPAFHEADIEFHAAILAGSGNSLIDALSTIIGPVLKTAFHVQAHSDTTFHAALEIHEGLFDAIVRKDVEGARAAMTAILDGAAVELDQAFARRRRAER
jgi:DNA-binding FadR family transcriptional regulator